MDSAIAAVSFARSDPRGPLVCGAVEGVAEFFFPCSPKVRGRAAKCQLVASLRVRREPERKDPCCR